MKLNRGLLLLFVVCWSMKICAQSNLLEDPSFVRERNRFPKEYSQLKKVGVWKNYLHDYPSINLTKTTSDWYRVDPNYFQGGYTCDSFPHYARVDRGGLDTTVYTPIPPHDDDYYAGFIWWGTIEEGEAMQQKLSTPVTKGFYDFSFWYFPPCDTLETTVSLWFTTKKHKRGHKYKAFTVTLPNSQGHNWTRFQRQLYIPIERNYDWFFLQIENPDSVEPGLWVYTFVDDFFLGQADCDQCGPTGQMAVNRYHPLFFSPNGDGYNDEFCVTHINNAQKARLSIYDNVNTRIWREEYTNHTGLYNFPICWPGTYQNGNPAGAGSYSAILKLWNCDTEREVAFSIDHCGANPCPTEPIVPRTDAIQETFHHPPPPFAHQELHLYGHHPEVDSFRACKKILVGDSVNIVTPSFSTDSLSTALTLTAGEEIDLIGYVDLTGSLDLKIDSSLQCCPDWLQNKPDGPEITLDTLVPQPILEDCLQEGYLTDPITIGLGKPFPNPFRESTTIPFSLGEEGEVTLVIFDLHMHPVAILVEEHKEPGRYEITFSPMSIPAGLYFCSLTTGNYTSIKTLMYTR